MIHSLTFSRTNSHLGYRLSADSTKEQHEGKGEGRRDRGDPAQPTHLFEKEKKLPLRDHQDLNQELLPDLTCLFKTQIILWLRPQSQPLDYIQWSKKNRPRKLTCSTHTAVIIELIHCCQEHVDAPTGLTNVSPEYSAGETGGSWRKTALIPEMKKSLTWEVEHLEDTQTNPDTIEHVISDTGVIVYCRIHIKFPSQHYIF